MDVEAIRKEVEDAGKRHLAASMAGDSEALDQLLAEELIYTHSNGFTDARKADYLAFVGDGTYVAQGMTVEHSVDRFIAVSDDLAIVRGKQITNTTGATATGKWEDVEAASLDIWVRRDDRWQLIAHQSTLVLDADGYRKAFVASH